MLRRYQSARTTRRIVLHTAATAAFIRAGTAHLMETPGHGAWEHVRDRDYAITYDTLRFDPSGLRRSSKDLSPGDTDADATTFEARTRTLTIDADGTEVLGAEGSNRGVRMVPEPFPLG